MKKLLYIFPLLGLIIFLSCDSKGSTKDRLKQSVSEFNKSQKLIDLKNYYPESYVETKTDSIISKTFSVTVKNYTLMDSEIFISESTKGLRKTSEYHRVFASDIIVSVSEKIIYDKHISAATFEGVSTSKFWQNATLEHVWVNQDDSNSKIVSLGISFINPKSKSSKLYEMQIDKNGNEYITLIEDHS